MSFPTLTYGFNHSATDSPWGYAGTGSPTQGGWREIDPLNDTVVFTGGGILGTLPVPTTTSGARDATIKPTLTSFVIPQTYVESDIMYVCNQTGHNANRYAMAVYVDGTCTSDLYLEAWDDNSFSTTNSEVLQGTTNSADNSFINAIRTTASAPPWSPGWSGSDGAGAYLRGTDDRIGLANASTVTDQSVYYNIYIRLETDCTTFHNTPILGFRYLYT